jgi:hypothetical protein
VEYGVATGNGGFGTRYTTYSRNEPDAPMLPVEVYSKKGDLIDVVDEKSDCFDGLVKVSKKGKYGYIDVINGRYLIEPKLDFVYLGCFKEGLAEVKVNGKWGYIDETGKIVIEPKFDKAWSFSESLAGVEVNGKWGYIDKTGKIVPAPK